MQNNFEQESSEKQKQIENLKTLIKEIKDEKMTYKIEDAKTGGKGTVEFNLSKGIK